MGKIVFNNAAFFRTDARETGMPDHIEELHINPDEDKNLLYLTEDSNLDYTFAKQYFRNRGSFGGACSSLRKGDFYGRNYDWTYSNQLGFVVKVKDVPGKYNSVGVAHGVGELSKETINRASHSQLLRLIPFQTLDGINEFGVVSSQNVVPLDVTVKASAPLITQKDSICSLMLVRYVLDNFESASDAVDYITKYVSVYQPKALLRMNYSLHVMIADSNNTYCLEFIDDTINVIDMSEDSDSDFAGKSYMTNFMLTDVILNSDGTVYTPETRDGSHSAMMTNHITKYGAGLERYNLIVNGINNVNSVSTMRALLEQLKYTNAYITSPNPAVPFWYTEAIGCEVFVPNAMGISPGQLTVDTYPDEFQAVVDIMGEMYLNRDRWHPTTWQTVHSTVYDIERGKLYIRSEEGTNEFVYDVP